MRKAMTTHVRSAPEEELTRSFSPREVVAAWIVAIVLLLGTGISFALDHMVTVSDRTDWSSLVNGAPGSGEADDEGDLGNDTREIRDSEAR